MKMLRCNMAKRSKFCLPSDMGVANVGDRNREAESRAKIGNIMILIKGLRNHEVV
jgi:hypothetical protein